MDGEGAAGPVVVVEDDTDTRDMITGVLERAGYRTRSVSDGLRLLDMLQKERPSVVLLDVMLSWIDGFELCRALKKNPDLKGIPVVFVSARTSDEDRRRGLDSGGEDYFTKPVDFDRLLKKLGDITERRE
jgi:DNA-binding response OmpR family regulator